MHLDLPLCANTTARLTLSPHGRLYHLLLSVSGQRPATAGLVSDLLLAPEGGGVLTLRPVKPFTGGSTGRLHWNAVYAMRHEQLILMAIYPMTRLTLAPWTGAAGVCLHDLHSRRGLMILARTVLGLPIDQLTGETP